MRGAWQFVLCVGCGAAPAAPTSPPPPVAAADFFPDRVEGEVHHEVWGRHVALMFGGRVYATNGDDLPSQIMVALWPVLLGGDEGGGRRVALIGIGSGVELAVLLAEGAEVDLFEPDRALLENAARLRESSGLAFQAGVPVHQRLRIYGGPDEVPPDRLRYDVILHSDAATVIHRPPALFRVERFQRLARYLAPGGILGIHLQLYEMRDAHHPRLLATFAAAFSHALVAIPEDLSSDTHLFGSEVPLRLPAARLRRVHADEALRPFREAAHYTEPFDPVARILMRSKDEIQAYAAGARPFTEAAPLPMDDWPVRPPALRASADPDAPRLSNEAWGEMHREWMEAEGLDDGVVVRFYEQDWPFGSPCDDEACALLGEVTAADLAEIAYVHTLHGQSRRAIETLARIPHGASPRVGEVRSLLEALLGGADPDLAPLDLLGVHVSTPGAAAVARAWQGREQPGGWDNLLEAVRALGETEVDLNESAGHLLLGIIELNRPSGADTDALRHLCERDRGICERFPAGWHYMARALYTDHNYRDAVTAMERYLAARSGTPSRGP